MSRSDARHAFTLVETVIASIIIGTVLVASLNAVGAASTSSRRVNDKHAALLLASDLMSEILTMPYADPEIGATATLGPEAGEDDGTREFFDDADDYHNWTASPPVANDASPLMGFGNWSRSVTCRRLTPSSLAVDAADTGVLEITVTVRYRGTTLATLVSVRTDSWDGP